MESLNLTQEELVLGLRALKTVAACHGGVHASERTLLTAAARALGVETDVDALAPIEPDELRAGLGPPAREKALQAMMVMAIMDGEATADEVLLIERFGKALGVDEPRVANLRQLAEGRVRFLWLDLARKSFARKDFTETFRDEGLAGLWKIVGPMVGMAKDYDLARRYNDLGQLGAGTLGRAYWEFVTGNGFGFPGEERAVPERGVWHDLTHVLGGYKTDPIGEVQVVSFIAGYRREDPFFWLFTIALQFHLGLKVSPYSPGGVKGVFDPERVIAAMKRGMAMNLDLSTGWDYWPVLALPLDEVRLMYNVPPA